MSATQTRPSVYIEEIPSEVRTITGASTSITAFIGRSLMGPVDKVVKIHSFAEYEHHFVGLWRKCNMSYAVHQYFMNGGMTALIVRVDNAGHTLKDTSVIGDPDAKTGIYALDNVDSFNLLCIPPYREDGETTPGPVYTAALRYCERRRAMLIVDPPGEWRNGDSALNGIESPEFGLVRSTNAAIFFPRIKAPDPMEVDIVREFVPCGAVAGVIARTDGQRGVWKSPAGIEATLKGVSDLSVRLTDAEISSLNSLGINCLRIMPGHVVVVWGARTMRGEDRLVDPWKYLSVRRMTLYIEESLYRGTQWVVFEHNDEPLWSQIRLNVGAFMHSLFRQGAFQGSTQKEAYFVKCDRETMTQDDIDRGIVNIIVGFAPLKPAEFIILRIQQIIGQ